MYFAAHVLSVSNFDFNSEKQFCSKFRDNTLMFSLIIELKFADRLSYVNRFMPYDSRFSMPLVVFVLLNFNLIKVMKYLLVIFIVIQHMQAASVWPFNPQ
jgi:hypothetical protein